MNSRLFLDLIFKVVVVVALGVLTYLQLQRREEIVYVDSLKLLSRYKGMDAARAALAAKSETWQANLDTLKGELENVTKALTKSHTASPEHKRLEETMRAKQQQMLSYQEVVNEQFRKEDQELSVKVLGEVNDYIRRYSEEKSYALVLVATNGNVAYGDRKKDVTEDVLNGLNNEYHSVK